MSKPIKKRQQRVTAGHIAKGVSTTAMLTLIVAINTAYAQEAVKQDVIEVTGIRRGIENAIAVKKDSTSIVEVISAEDIGKLPDNSIAESIARLPGLAAQRVQGRAQTISIRGLSGDFAGTLLNGREQVTTGDNRGVEFDQYPSELLTSVLVYKTPDASLVGQGLSGTIDMQTARPLSFGKSTIALNLRGEKNSLGKLNSDSRDVGGRFSVSYIDQFANRTLGLVIGYAHLDSPSQSKRWEAWGYTDDKNAPGATVLGGFKANVDSVKQVRDGLMAALQYKPNAEFESMLDVYYSKFDKVQKTRGFEVGLPWGGATLSNPVVNSNGLLIGGNYSSIKPVLRNDLNKRTDDVTAFGWNNKLKLGEWKTSADLSYSKAKRKESILETYAGAATRDNATFSQDPDTGVVQLVPQFNYADPSAIKLVDSGGWGQDGYIKWLNVTDELKSLKLTGSHSLDFGPISNVDFGVNFSDRKKVKEVPEAFVNLLGSTKGPNGFTSSPTTVPANLLISPTSMSYVGLGNILSYNVDGALNSLYQLVPNINRDIWNKNWRVNEKVTTVYGKLDIDKEVGNVPIRGNFGVQVVRTDQSSTAYALPNGDANNPTPTTGGKTYTDVLPSLNLVANLGNDQSLRLGVARIMARARVDQLRASKSWNFDQNKPVGQQWSGDGGNPELDPFRADSVDLAYEKYFGTKAYFGFAAFYKQLKSYIYTRNDPYDFAGLVNPITGVVNPTGTIGKFERPLNGDGGNIHGFEATISLPLNLWTPTLDGFGIQASFADTYSEIQPFGPKNPLPLPGLSKVVTNLTVYYEKYGFSTRISQRNRSAYIGEITGFGADREFVFIKPESVVDAQVGYEFNSGTFKGMSLLFQINNVTNAPYARYDGRPEIPKEYVKYGRTYLFGVNYKL